MKNSDKGFGVVDILVTNEKEKAKSFFKNVNKIRKKIACNLRGEMENTYLNVAIKCGTNNTETSIIASSIDTTEIECSHCKKIIIFNELGRLRKSESVTVSSHTILVLKTNRDFSM